MKKITLLFTLFILSSGVNSQVLTQTFDTSLAPWTINTLVPDTTLPPSLGWYQKATGINPVISPFAGAGMAQFNSFSAVDGSVYELNSPSITFVSGSYRVRFNMYRDATYISADKIDIYYNTVSGSTGGTLIGTVNRNYTLSPVETAIAWYTYTLNIPGTLVGNGFISFKGTSAFGNNIYIDEVNVELQPSCVNPTALVSSAITTTTATVSWTAPTSAPANGYEYYQSTTNTAPIATTVPTGAIVAGIVTKNLTGLISGTTYYVWVRSKCSASSTSLWSLSVIFTTNCLPINSLPWTENFDSLTTIGFGITPNCWQNITGSKAWRSSNTATTTYNLPYSGPNYMNIAWSNIVASDLWTPGFNLTAGTNYAFSFYYNTNGITSSFIGFTGDVLVNTSKTQTGVTNLGTFITATQGTAAYTLYTVNFNPTATGTYYFDIRVSSTSAPWYLGVDDFKLMSSPLATSSFNNEGFSYYPNPVVDFLKLSYTQNIDKVEILNMLGQIVLTKVINSNESNLDMSSLAKGTYMVKVAAENQIKTIKVIKE